MTTIVGFRSGHRVTITVTGQPGSASIARQHHPNCPCRTSPPQPGRITRRRKPTTDR